MFDWLGWIATAAFAGSYFCTKPSRLRQIQALAALLWLGYGVLIKAPPVIAANAIVASLAIISSFGKQSGKQGREEDEEGEAEN
jgi:Bacterial inner membrane protein